MSTSASLGVTPKGLHQGLAPIGWRSVRRCEIEPRALCEKLELSHQRVRADPSRDFVRFPERHARFRAHGARGDERLGLPPAAVGAEGRAFQPVPGGCGLRPQVRPRTAMRALVLIGPGFLDHFVDATADDLPTNIRAMRSFAMTCLVKPPSDDVETAICWNVVVPATIRAALAAREIDDDYVLRTLEVPVLLTHGRMDSVVLPAMAEHVLVTCPTAEISWYDGVGHAPHLEEHERFNRELAALARRVRA